MKDERRERKERVEKREGEQERKGREENKQSAKLRSILVTRNGPAGLYRPGSGKGVIKKRAHNQSNST